MMGYSDEFSRREFLKTIPKYLMSSLHSLTEELTQPADITIEKQALATIDDGKAKIAEIDMSRCIAWDGGNCQFCYLVCPLKDRAITIEDQKPTINPAICDGCAKCLTACKTVNTTFAIKMMSRC